MTAYQVVHIMEGVVQRGTAQSRCAISAARCSARPARRRGRRTVWFVGGSPDLVGGVYLGYDRPRSLGGYAQGGTIAAPIFKQFAIAR